MKFIKNRAMLATGLVLVCAAGFVFFNSAQKTFPEVSLMETCFADNIVGASKVDGRWVTKTNVPLSLQGWSGDKVKTTVASDATVQLVDGENNVIKSWTTDYNVARPDVAQAFTNPALGNSGFNLDLEGISKAGAYKLQLGSVNSGTYQICINAIPLLVED